MLGQHQCSSIRLHQRHRSGHGGKLPGEHKQQIRRFLYFIAQLLISCIVCVPVCQVDHAKSLHYVGAGVTFPAGLLFVCLQCVLTYRVAVTALDYWMAHFRVALALGAMISLVLSILCIERVISLLSCITHPLYDKMYLYTMCCATVIVHFYIIIS